jgi:arylsulfatase A
MTSAMAMCVATTPTRRWPTPNIDKLASEGMRFTDAHSPATVCTPSRYSLMTGQMAFRVPNGGTVFQGTGGPSLIAPGKLTLPGMLKKQGYATAAVGKWHIGLTFRDQAGEAIHSGERAAVQRIDYSRRIEGGPLDHGFDQFFGTACCPTTEWLYAFIDGDHIPVPPTGPIDKSKLPKHPYANDCRAGFIAPDFPMEEVDLVFLKKSREFIAQHARTSPKQPFFLYHATQAVHLPSFAAPEFQGKSQAGPHGDFIAEFDHIVGELMRELDKHGLADNTLVILSSDNGPEVAPASSTCVPITLTMAPNPGAASNAMPGKAATACPSSCAGPESQSPAPPAIKPSASPTSGHRRRDHRCTELPPDAAEDSFNLLPALEGKATAPIRPYLLTQAFGGQRTLSIRRGPWKYIAHRGSGGNNYDKGELKPFALPDTDPEAPAQLYDLATDPGETTNLYSKHPEVVAETEGLLEKSISEGRSAPYPMNIVSIFNDVIGPVMRGPSSSHCAAALRIGRLARDLMDGEITRCSSSLIAQARCRRRTRARAATWGSLVACSAGRPMMSGCQVRAGARGGRDQAAHRNRRCRRSASEYLPAHAEEQRETHSLIAISTGGGMMEVIEIDGVPSCTWTAGIMRR